MDKKNQHPLAASVIVGIVAFAAGSFVGWHAKAAQDLNNERAYPIKVFDKIDPRHANVCKASETGECVSSKFKFATCPHEAAPSFDAGRLYMTSFQISSDDTGECNTFTGEHGYFREIPQ